MNKRVAHLASIVVFLLALVLTPAALAGKGGKAAGGGATSASVRLVLINSTDGLAHYGQQVTFTVSTSATKPWVGLDCWQNGTWVYGSWSGYFPSYEWGQVFTLGPTNSWNGGAADCKAKLVTFSLNGRERVLATTSFHVYP